MSDILDTLADLRKQAAPFTHATVEVATIAAAIREIESLRTSRARWREAVLAIAAKNPPEMNPGIATIDPKGQEP